MEIEVSVGEIVDKLSILQIKSESIKQEDKLHNVLKEYFYLKTIVFTKLGIDKSDYSGLLSINKKLWEIEDSIRIKESNKQFDYEFIELARLVYSTNDIRANLKKEINLKYNSNLIEEKYYSTY